MNTASSYLLKHALDLASPQRLNESTGVSFAAPPSGTTQGVAGEMLTHGQIPQSMLEKGVGWLSGVTQAAQTIGMFQQQPEQQQPATPAAHGAPAAPRAKPVPAAAPRAATPRAAPRMPAPRMK
jgi:hypothetical protein